jgi:acetyl-CoA C-acetyltransferase
MDAERTPVIVAAGQAIERSEIVSAVELAARAAEAALDQAADLRRRIQRVSMISVVFSPVSGRPASELVERLGLKEVEVEATTAGGNMPQWMVTRAARDIADGRLDATLIAGAEATRSSAPATPTRTSCGGSRSTTGMLRRIRSWVRRSAA